MYGLMSFFAVSIWFFTIESYLIELALQRGCVYSFWIFLITAIFSTYKTSVGQLSRILAYRKIDEAKSKWSRENTYEVIESFIYIAMYWIPLALVLWAITSDPKNFMTIIGFFVPTSIVIIQFQNHVLVNGIIKNVRVHMGS